MMTIRISITLSLLVLLTACGGPGEEADVPEAQPAGATSADIGDYAVHFNTQLTDELPPEFARALNVVRSKNRAMLIVSILRESDGVPVAGDVAVETFNLTAQLKNVALRRVDEPGVQGSPAAIYYMGITPVANRETLKFYISVTPEGVEKASEVLFIRQFYTD